MRPLHHPAHRQHCTGDQGHRKRDARKTRFTITQREKQREQAEPGGRMTARPAQPRLVGSRPWLKQLAVGFRAAELREAPRALHLRQFLQRRDEGGGYPQCEHQAAQFAAPAVQALDQKTCRKHSQCQDAQHDNALLDSVMQDVF